MKKVLEIGGLLLSVDLEAPAILTDPPTPPTLNSIRVVDSDYVEVGPDLVGWLVPLHLPLQDQWVGIVNIIAGEFLKEQLRGH